MEPDFVNIMMVVVLLFAPSLVCCCGGRWTEDVNNWLISDTGTITKCDYTNKLTGSVKTPADIRQDTQYLKLNGNSIQDGDLDIPLIHSQVTALLGLDLEDNLLTQIPDLSTLKDTLCYLSVGNNNLFQVNLGAFHSLTALTYLIISKNSLQMSDITFSTAETPVPLLHTVDISDNEITQIDWTISQYLPDLNGIILSGNPITDINEPIPTFINHLRLNGCFSMSGVFDLTPYLQVSHFRIAHNHITGFTCSTTVAPFVMKRLYIDWNSLQTLDLDYFNKIAPNLKELFASYNNITEVLLSRHDSQILPLLEKLDLTHNPLISVPYYCFPRFSHISNGFRLDLSGTSLYCGESLLWLTTCPYQINLDKSPAACAGPPELAGKGIMEAADKLVYFTSRLKKDTLFSWSGLHGTAGLVMVEIKVRGFVDCARLCAAAQGLSFTFIGVSHSCVIYHDDSGTYKKDN